MKLSTFKKFTSDIGVISTPLTIEDIQIIFVKAKQGRNT